MICSRIGEPQFNRQVNGHAVPYKRVQRNISAAIGTLPNPAEARHSIRQDRF